jgi:hypothetical protein
MKKYFWFIAMVLLFDSCKQQQSPDELIVKTWKLSNIKYEREISEDVKPIIEAQIQALRETFRLEYKADKTYHSHSVKDETGKWQLNADSMLLKHIDSNYTQTYKIELITNDSLHLKTTLQTETITLQLIPE